MSAISLADPPAGLALARRRTALRMLLRRRWLEHLASTGTPDPVVDRLLGHLTDDPAAELEHRRQAEAALWQEVQRFDEAAAADTTSRLGRLCVRLGLGPAERGLLELCLAVGGEPVLGAVCADLQQRADLPFVTLPLAARLLDLPVGHAWDADGPVFRWRLVWTEPTSRGAPDAVVVDPHVQQWAAGSDSVDPALGERAEVIAPLTPFSTWPVEATATAVERIWTRGHNAQVTVVGAAGSGRRTFAAAVAAALGNGLLAVDLTGSAEPERLVFSAHRDAILLGVVPCFLGVDEPPAADVPHVALRCWVSAEPRPPVVATRPDDPVDEVVCLPDPSLEERARLLHTGGALDLAQATRLLVRDRLRIGELQELLARGTADADGLQAASEAAAARRLDGVGALLPRPFTRDDLVLEPDLTDAFDLVLAEARVRDRVLRDYPGGATPRAVGLSILFHGPPGTGKTMASQVVARELGVPLVRIDVSAVVSKYIGETAKALRRIFATAEELDAVLFFDEADALFARRTALRDAHDRHANADTSYLLTLLEDRRGITVLATNQRANLDPAFQRRLRHVLAFPPPERTERARLWDRAFALLRRDDDSALDDSFRDRLAEVVELSGAEVQAAALTALFVAADRDDAVQPADVLAAVELELKKSERSLRPAERQRIIAHG
jgi:MoxR-like ATPase